MKLRLSPKHKEKIKKAMIISLPLIFALTAAVAIAFLIKPRGEEVPPNKELEETKEKDEIQVVAPVETTREEGSAGLEFLSKGNGSCSLVGIGSCTDENITVPSKSPSGDVVIEVGIGAFADCQSVRSITLPDSIVTIGAGAFLNCTKLESISVGDANPLFSSDEGVLFNKAKTILLAYPAGKTDEIYTLPDSVSRIAERAFVNCKSLKTLKFLGTETEWSAIYIAAGNTALNQVEMEFYSADK